MAFFFKVSIIKSAAFQARLMRIRQQMKRGGLLVNAQPHREMKNISSTAILQFRTYVLRKTPFQRNLTLFLTEMLPCVGARTKQKVRHL